MNKRNTILVVVMLLLTLPVLAIVKGNIYKLGNSSNAERCSMEIEQLKLCVVNSKITVDAGQPVKVKLYWINSSNIERRIGTRSTGYSVTIDDERGKKLIPVFQDRKKERERRLDADPQATMTEEDLREVGRRIKGGSERGIFLEANGTATDEIELTEAQYDYDFTVRGKYYVTISKSIPSLGGESSIEVAVDNIEIKVR